MISVEIDELTPGLKDNNGGQFWKQRSFVLSVPVFVKNYNSRTASQVKNCHFIRQVKVKAHTGASEDE